MKTPWHKHITRRVKKYHSHITKYLYERDTIFATIWVFIFIGALSVFAINTHFFDPVKLALEDFELNDISYSKIKSPKNAPLDSNIKIINIGYADREELAAIIEKTSSMHPKVIGLDAYFDGPKEPEKDSIFRMVLEKTKNLVTVNRIRWEGHHEEELTFMKDYFDSSFAARGYANFMGEERGTIRLFSPFEKKEETNYPSFAAALVKYYDPAAYKKLQKRHTQVELINYTRRVNQYHVIQADVLLAGNVAESTLKDKIVLLGFVDTNPDNIEDKVFTPMNEKFAGKSIPDMNGIIVHANIISMILERNYIKKLPSWINVLIAILIGWLHMSFFIRYYLEDHIWFHLVAKLAQLISAVFFAYIGMVLYKQFSIQLDMKITLVVIVFAVDIIYFYEAFAVWMHKRFNYHTVFHQKHH